MLVGSIVSGIQVLSSVISVVRGFEQRKCNNEFNKTLRRISIRLSLLQKQIDCLDRRLEVPPQLLNRYNNLVSIARENELFGKHIRFCRTQKGTWVLTRKRKRNILRDPQGEYCKGNNK